jgi:hypothetical protein
MGATTGTGEVIFACAGCMPPSKPNSSDSINTKIANFLLLFLMLIKILQVS